LIKKAIRCTLTNDIIKTFFQDQDQNLNFKTKTLKFFQDQDQDFVSQDQDQDQDLFVMYTRRRPKNIFHIRP